ncbi:Ger(x)C family spore germination protein [Sporolactobacillus shoreicorticis]|uniref:Ger(X)C family spore germination protein n=1 Tax=Sporolactobacillus shoreicorticis TaxID=1923877 RepID=A0ABW5RX95_9BACL|nr:Ger(x)C family spore germination protein [Sporolactobacillus shoreicorticis]MCO7124907.1 Ger(x)C family spore germination protein [Sporolactobacillus shoreicorticis]
MKRLISLISCILFLALSGCVQPSIIDDILMAEAEGLDYLGDNKVLGTITVPNYVTGGVSGSGGGGLPATAAMMSSASAITYDGKSLVEKLQVKGQKAIRVGKLRVMLLNKAYLQHGIRKLIEFRNQDPDVGRDLYLIMVDGSTKELLEGTYQTQIPISRYIYDLIFHNQEKNFPLSNMKIFMYKYYGAHMNAYMPIIKKQGKHIVLTGYALIENNRYAGTVMGDNANFIFKSLLETVNLGYYDYEYKPGQHFVLEDIQSTISYKVKNGNGAEPKITAQVKMSGNVRQGNPEIKTKNYYTKMKKKLQNHLENRMENMVAAFQKKGVDPIGLGDIARSYTRHFNDSSWEDHYPNAQFRAHVSIDINETGSSEMHDSSS